jgi:hypothetical protein
LQAVISSGMKRDQSAAFARGRNWRWSVTLLASVLVSAASLAIAIIH